MSPQSILSRAVLPAAVVLLSIMMWASAPFKEVAAGTAIFLFGMLLLEDGFTAFTGGVLERILRRTTDTVSKSLLFGIVSTSIMQSSSLVSLISISFISAGMITLVSGIGILFGANIGTTTGAWLVALYGLKVNIAQYAMPMLVLGILLRFQRAIHWRGLGAILAGLGFLFLGIQFMKDGFAGFGEQFDLSAVAIPGLLGLLSYTAIGIAATVLMQSSHATLVLILTALAAGSIAYTDALAVAIGANVGTTITAIIGAIGATTPGKRLAGAHLLFNCVTAAVALLLIQPMAAAVESSAELLGIAADNHTLKLALFHTLFNLLGVALMLPLIHRLAAALERWLPEPAVDVVQPQYLNDEAAQLPQSALSMLRQENWHLFETAFEILAHGIQLHRRDIISSQRLTEVISSERARLPVDIDTLYEQKLKTLYGAIVAFEAKASSNLPDPLQHSLQAQRLAASNLIESVKHIKHLHKNLIHYTHGDDVPIRAEYDRLRLGLARVLREFAMLQEHAGSSLASLQIEELEAEVQVLYSSIIPRVSELLNSGQIDPGQATSLLNDQRYANQAVENLITAVRILLSTAESRWVEAMQEPDVAEAESSDPVQSSTGQHDEIQETVEQGSQDAQERS